MVDTRHEYSDLAHLYLPIAVGVWLVVFLAVSFALIRYRRRGDDLPAQREESNAAELVYAFGLACVAALLVGATFSTEDRVDRVSARAGLEVKVTAAQWTWRFSYPAYGVTEPGTDTRPALLVVPTGTTVHFTATSRDVIHS